MDVKYYAGLFDADGSFGIQVDKRQDGTFRLSARASLKQLEFRAKPLKDLAEELKGTLYTELHEDKPGWRPTCGFVVTHQKAVSLMEKLKNHLVIKREVVDYILTINGQVVNKEVLKAIKKILKDLRYEIHTLNKNHPSRRWMAGYIDGDGCIRSQVRRYGGLSTKLEVTSYDRDTQGVELLQKAFGGSINKHGNNAIRWVVNITENNANKIIGYFQKHSSMKRTQLLYVLDYLNKGKHLKKRGATLESNTRLKETLQQLKQPQRLSEKTPSGEAIV